MLIFELTTFEAKGDRDSALIIHLMLAVVIRIEHYLKCGKLPDDWQARLCPLDKHYIYCDRPNHNDGLTYSGNLWDNAKVEMVESPLHGADLFLYGDVRSSEWQEYYKNLSLAIACLSFVPGGIEIFGHRIQSRFEQPT
jgi:hypothetical protein